MEDLEGENSSNDDSDDENENGVTSPEDKRRDIFLPFDHSDHLSTCSPPCSERTTCSNCTHGLCMWCKNLEMCIERNAYLVRVPPLVYEPKDCFGDSFKSVVLNIW